jgi:hypothetical protein
VVFERFLRVFDDFFKFFFDFLRCYESFFCDIVITVRLH